MTILSKIAGDDLCFCFVFLSSDFSFHSLFCHVPLKIYRNQVRIRPACIYKYMCIKVYVPRAREDLAHTQKVCKKFSRLLKKGEWNNWFLMQECVGYNLHQLGSINPADSPPPSPTNSNPRWKFQCQTCPRRVWALVESGLGPGNLRLPIIFT